MSPMPGTGITPTSENRVRQTKNQPVQISHLDEAEMTDLNRSVFPSIDKMFGRVMQGLSGHFEFCIRMPDREHGAGGLLDDLFRRVSEKHLFEPGTAV
jgi:hypothetical protein